MVPITFEGILHYGVLLYDQRIALNVEKLFSGEIVLGAFKFIFYCGVLSSIV